MDASLIFGRDRRTSRNWLLGTFVVAAGVVVGFELHFSRGLGGVVFVPGPLALWMFLPAAAQAYRNDGLLVCWALGASAGLGWTFWWFVFGITHRPLAGRLADAVTSPVYPAIGVVLATVGFGFGAALYRLRGTGRPVGS